VEHERVVKPSLVRAQPLIEADVPLADHARRVSGSFEFFSQAWNIARHAEVG